MKHIVWTLALAAGLAWGPAGAQAPAAPDAAAAPATAAPATPAATGGIQSQSIFQVKPDASADPQYAEQTNGERMKVQPGNNAPMWRQVGQGVTGYSSLPKTQAPEAGLLWSTPARVSPMQARHGARCATSGSFPMVLSC